MDKTGWDDYDYEIYEKYLAERRARPESQTAGLGFFVALSMRQKMKKIMLDNTDIFWITVNPRPDVRFDFFKKTVSNLMERVFMKGAVYAFEQRSEDDKKPHGYHCHILVDKRMSPKQMYDRVFNTFKAILGTKKALDIRSYEGRFRDEKMDYLRGIKWDPDKDKAVFATCKWRESIGIEAIYKN